MRRNSPLCPYFRQVTHLKNLGKDLDLVMAWEMVQFDALVMRPLVAQANQCYVPKVSLEDKLAGIRKAYDEDCKPTQVNT